MYRARQNPGYHRVVNYAYQDVEDEDAPIGHYREYRWELEEIPTDGVSLTFYTVHQEAEVYFDGELMYCLRHSAENNVGTFHKIRKG